MNGSGNRCSSRINQMRMRHLTHGGSVGTIDPDRVRATTQKSEITMNLSTKMKDSTKRRRAAAERRSLQRVLHRLDAGLRDELIEMHELGR